MIALLDLYQVEKVTFRITIAIADIRDMLIDADPEPDCLPKNWPDECHGK